MLSCFEVANRFQNGKSLFLKNRFERLLIGGIYEVLFRKWYHRPESNRHSEEPDFESGVSTNFTTVACAVEMIVI